MATMGSMARAMRRANCNWGTAKSNMNAAVTKADESNQRLISLTGRTFPKSSPAE